MSPTYHVAVAPQVICYIGPGHNPHSFSMCQNQDFSWSKVEAGPTGLTKEGD